jgi:magnesium transporter
MIQQTVNAADELLDQWPHLRRSERVPGFQALPREQMDNFFLALDAKSQSDLVLALPEGERRMISKREYLLELMDDMTRQDARALLAYREDAAGGLINPRFARLRPEASIDEAITYLRQELSHVETIYYTYVLDEQQRLQGVVSLKDLVLADRKKTVRDVMTTKLFKVSEDTGQEPIAHLLSVHGIQAIPVVDSEGHMKGIITRMTSSTCFARRIPRRSRRSAALKRWMGLIWRLACLL